MWNALYRFLRRLDWWIVGIIAYIVIMWLLWDNYWTIIYNK